MNHSYEKLKEDLYNIGLQAGESVLVHSSYKSMGVLSGGIQTFIEAIQSVIKDRGTLIVPTLTFDSVTEENPVFNHAQTPSCVGAISEYVRHIDGALRSVHPTHSCAALGGRAQLYTETHYLDDTPVGRNSPFFKLKEEGGKILMLGCGLKPNTSMHGVEEACGVSYLLSKHSLPYTIITASRTYQKGYYRHHIKQNGYAQRYDRIINAINHEHIREGSVHGAQSYLIDAAELWRCGIEVLKKDELFFVDKINPCCNNYGSTELM